MKVLDICTVGFQICSHAAHAYAIPKVILENLCTNSEFQALKQMQEILHAQCQSSKSVSVFAYY